MRAQPECMGERGLSTDGNTGFKQRILGHHPQLAHKRLPLSTHDPLSGRVTVTDMSNLPISPFWRRLTDALSEARLPTSQLGLAKLLGMSQGSIQRWVRGDGLPEFETVITLARRARVCVEWLLTERGPKHPEPSDPDLTDLLQLWTQLHPHGRAHVLRTAKNEYSAQSTAGMAPFNNPKIN